MTPVPVQIRRIIFERFNDPDAPFTNDQIFEILKEKGGIDPGMIIDDLEQFFVGLCDERVMRNIAQNFTTMHFKLFEPLSEIKCDSCDTGFCGISSEKTCPSCGTSI